jgi:preprotein translocase subunit SecE
MSQNKPEIKETIFSEIRSELKNVTWPTRPQALKLTGIVVIICLIVGLYIGIIDVAFAKVLELLTKIRK